MSKSAKKRSVGRPATGRDPVRSLRMPKDMIMAIEKWQRINIHRPKLTISDAVRELITIGLRADEKARSEAS